MLLADEEAELVVLDDEDREDVWETDVPKVVGVDAEVEEEESWVVVAV